MTTRIVFVGNFHGYAVGDKVEKCGLEYYIAHVDHKLGLIKAMTKKTWLYNQRYIKRGRKT